MTQPAIDVHEPPIPEVKLTRGVATICHRQKRRRKERRFALSAVRVAGKDPAAKIVPHWQIRRIGVVAQSDGRLVWLELRQYVARTKVGSPQIVDSHKTQPTHNLTRVPQHADTDLVDAPDQFIRHFPISPS